MVIRVPIVTRDDCERGRSSTQFVRDGYLYVMRRHTDRFPWEHLLGKNFDRTPQARQMTIFSQWKADNAERWDELCNRWNFDPTDEYPWIHYALQADEREEEWRQIEGKQQIDNSR